MEKCKFCNNEDNWDTNGNKGVWKNKSGLCSYVDDVKDHYCDESRANECCYYQPEKTKIIKKVEVTTSNYQKERYAFLKKAMKKYLWQPYGLTHKLAMKRARTDWRNRTK